MYVCHARRPENAIFHISCDSVCTHVLIRKFELNWGNTAGSANDVFITYRYTTELVVVKKGYLLVYGANQELLTDFKYDE